MQKHRYKASFLLSVSIYVVLGAFYLFLSSKSIVIVENAVKKPITMSLSEFVPEEVVVQPPEPIEEPVVEEVVEEPVVKPEPKPVPPVVIEKVMPKPVVKKVEKKVKKKDVKKKVAKKKKEKKKKTKKKTSKKKVSHKAPSKRTRASSVNPKKSKQFLSRLRAKINQKKSYPKMARRRGMQGTVKVSFVIQRNGHVGNIVVHGPKVFHKSAKNAVKKAFPISTKNASISLPLKVNLSLRYKLR